jgi:hypothetical protein
MKINLGLNRSDRRKTSVHREKEHHKEGCNTSFSIQIQTSFTSNPRRSPPILPYLIGTKNKLLTHFYSRNYKNELSKWQEATAL